MSETVSFYIAASIALASVSLCVAVLILYRKKCLLLRAVQKDAARARGSCRTMETTSERANARYKAVVKESEDLVCRWKRDTTLTFVNVRFAATFQKPVKELLESKWLDLFPADERDKAEILVNDMCAKPEPRQVRHELVLSNGSVRHLQWYIVPLVDRKGEVFEFQAVGQDLTQLFQTRRMRDDAFRLLEQFVSVSPAAVYCSRFSAENADRRWFTFVSSNSERVLGHNAKAITTRGNWWGTNIHPDDVVTVRQAVMAAEVGKPAVCEYRIRQNNGQYRWLEDRFTVSLCEAGNALEIVGAWTDVTVARKTQRTLSQLQSAMKYSTEAVAVLDKGGKLSYSNPALAKLTGYSLAEQQALDLSELADPVWVENNVPEIVKTLENGKVWHGDLTLYTKSGSKLETELSVYAGLGRNGEIEEYVVVGRDRRKQASLEAQLRQSQKLEAIGQLAGGIAHDFNNVLTVIMGNAQFIQESLHVNSEAYSDISEILDLSKKASSLTRQLLAFSRRQSLQAVRLDVKATVGNIDKMLRRIMGEDIQHKFVAEPDLWDIKADPGHIEQILMNLAINSRDAMPEGGEFVIHAENAVLQENEISRELIGNCDSATAGAYVVLTVTDTGCGMTEEMKKLVFEPFFTTKDAEHGTGLGLSTVYGIVRQHGGHITLRSEYGKGTTFRIYLPAAFSEEKAETEKKPVGKEDRKYSETILFVEDEAPVRKVAVRILSNLGYKVIAASDGHDALRVARNYKGKIDLLLADLIMPNMDGKKLAEKIQKLRPRLKVLYASGYPSGRLARHKVDVPSELLLLKPFSADGLAEKVREILTSDDAGVPRSAS